MDKKRDPFACAVIAELGGTAKTSRLFGLRMPSISSWKETGIPPARLMYLEVARPDALEAARKKVRKRQRQAEPGALETEDDVQPPVGTPPDHK